MKMLLATAFLAFASCAYVPKWKGIQTPEDAKDVILEYENSELFPLFQAAENGKVATLNITPEDIEVTDHYFTDFYPVYSQVSGNARTTWFGVRKIQYRDIRSVRVKIPAYAFMISSFVMGIVGPAVFSHVVVRPREGALIPRAVTERGKDRIIIASTGDGGDIGPDWRFFLPCWLFDPAGKRTGLARYGAAVLYMVDQEKRESRAKGDGL